MAGVTSRVQRWLEDYDQDGYFIRDSQIVLLLCHKLSIGLAEPKGVR
jgi:hypothetical protein